MKQALLDRLIALGRRMRKPLPPRIQRPLLGLAALAFVVGGWLSFRALDLQLDEISWAPILVAALLGVPITAVVNATEYVVSGRVLGHRIGWATGFRVTVTGTAANLLPIPGSTLVRVGGLASAGSGYLAATVATIAIGIAWVGVACLVAAVVLLLGGADLLATAGFAAGGAATVGLVPLLLARVRPDVSTDPGDDAGTAPRPDPGPARRSVAWWTWRVLGVELLSVASGVFRLTLVLYALPTVDDALTGGVVLAVSAAVSSAAGVFPGGLGLQELLSAGFAPIVGLAAAAGFAGSALNRLIGIAVHAPIAVGLVVTRPDADPATPDSRSAGAEGGSAPS